MLEWCLAPPLAFRRSFSWDFALATLLLIPFLGADLFPTVDAGQIRLHLRAPIGTRVEETAALCDRVEQSIRRQIPPGRSRGNPRQHRFPDQRHQPDAQQQRRDRHLRCRDSRSPSRPTTAPSPPTTSGRLRRTLPREFPGTEFYFQPADIVSQVLNFGLPAPIDIQLAGPNVRAELRSGPQAAAAAEGGARRRRRAHPPGLQPAAAGYRPWTAPRPKKWA